MFFVPLIIRGLNSKTISVRQYFCSDWVQGTQAFAQNITGVADLHAEGAHPGGGCRRCAAPQLFDTCDKVPIISLTASVPAVAAAASCNGCGGGCDGTGSGPNGGGVKLGAFGGPGPQSMPGSSYSVPSAKTAR